MTDDMSVLYVYECVLFERWVYVLCYVSCLSFSYYTYLVGSANLRHFACKKQLH